MVGVAPQPEYRVKCLPPITFGGGDERLIFEVNGRRKGVSLKIRQLSRQLVAALPDRALDLIEIAALVYAVDASVSRGGLTDQHMGAKWHRRFLIEMPVLDLSLWTSPDLQRDLEETLMFLSGDKFEFKFVQREGRTIKQSGFFDYGPDSAWVPDTVMMFSGGLDSFAGALEELVERKNKVALISHFSSSKIAPIQQTLQKAISEKLGPGKSMHFPMRVQLQDGTNSEGTHRTRSLLFAALGVATALSFGKDKVSFYENGIVSLNLPPVGNVLGTRATRTTHPQTLIRFSKLFSSIFNAKLIIDNPFFWRTKTDIVSKIHQLGMGDQIANTRSCADVHNQTKQYAHCGRCSQCIDRRFAILAAGLQAQDPQEAYRVDLMTGVRKAVQDKEAALSYVRNAFGFEAMTSSDLEQRFPPILDAVEHLHEPASTALSRLTELLRRHGTAVAGVMRETMDGKRPDQFPKDSLPFLFGEQQRETYFTPQIPLFPNTTSEPSLEKFMLVFDEQRKCLTINDAIEVKGADYGLFICLAKEHLRAAGLGLDPLDYPTTTARKLARALQVEASEAVRRRILRARNALAKKATSAGLDPHRAKALIENLPSHGYRLAPDLVIVRMPTA
ncbi:7-cyano-7-deazaguanine synthase [Litoreibacter janthinus]|uniref:7-cyano-7-deazaguanine synthase (Queuosine biosynthesis) n=1 Tax=Litoreibacter janthinus TaxID=670154 RepID=A0A1I6H0D9_9RHOB|nr:7-cyano-7-deazaguanine synthase [Litoreibacter janthinus]SFR47918.1 7-cyano-7-deazaguanine synthase (queuosine biosynthesis) [Litoreibacter janthinus]